MRNVRSICSCSIFVDKHATCTCICSSLVESYDVSKHFAGTPFLVSSSDDIVELTEAESAPVENTLVFIAPGRGFCDSGFSSIHQSVIPSGLSL